MKSGHVVGAGRFSNRWNFWGLFFQSLENSGRVFPIIGKRAAACLLAALTCAPAARALDYTNTIETSRAAITNLMAQHNIPGCTIVLVESQRVVWAEGFGYANRETQTPVTTNTVMAIGSVSKLLTTLMALQLVDTHVFELESCITNYLPEVAMQPRYANQTAGWTLRALLDHHAGLPGDIYNGSFAAGPYWSGYTRWVIDYFKDDYPLYPPNLLASYCNSGFNLVGEAIAVHDGVDYTAAAENRLFTPLEMPYSSFLPDKVTVAQNLATGYNADGSPAPDLVANMPATGGAFSRPLDMANVIKMMLAEGMFAGSRFLSTNALAKMGTFTPGPLDVDNFFRPGLGLDSVDDPVLKYAGRTWMKNGSTGKFESLFEVLPDQQLGAFVNINCANNMTFALLRIVLAKAVQEKSGLFPPDPPPMPDVAETNWSFAQLQAVEGDYATKTGLDRFVAETNGTLSYIPNAQSSDAVTVTNLRPHVNGRFYVPGAPGQQLVFTNSAGYDVVLRYGSDGSVADAVMYGGYAETLYGTRCVLPVISEAWSNRCGTFWMADNIMRDDSFVADGNPCGCMLSCENGILSMVSSGGNGVLIPTNDTVAFVAGLSTRGDSAVRVETNAAGQERLWFGAYRCVRVEDIPMITNLAIEDLSLALHTNALFKYGDMDAGQPVALVGSSNAEDVVFTIISTESLSVIAGGTGTVEWVCEEEPVVISIRVSETKDVRIRQVCNGWVHDGMKKTLGLYPRVPGFMTAIQEPGFLPLVMTEGYACLQPPSTNENALLTGDERFRMASISKLYTATAIMLLRDRGLLALTNTVAELAPELMAPRGDEITVELLLAHRSGLADANNTPWIDDKLDNDRFLEFTIEEIVGVASNMYPLLMFEPGTDYHYTDTGYNILARIIENRSGTNYQAFLKTQLLDPLGLTNTFVPFNNECDVPAPVMHAYASVGGVYDDWTRYSPSAEFGCGSVIADIRDLMRFASLVLHSTNVLSAESRALMMDPLSQTGSDSFAGRGAMFKDGFGWGHGGNMWGVNSYVAVDTNSGVIVAAVNNGMEYDDPQKLFNAVFALYGAMGEAKSMLGYETDGGFGAKPPVIINTRPSARQSTEFSHAILCGNFPTNWSALNLPGGMSINPETGVIAGIPAATGNYEVILTAHNPWGTMTTGLTFTVMLGYTNTIAKMTEYLNGALASNEFVGLSLALVDGADVIWADGFGWADRERAIPADAQTVYGLGGISKLFTSIAALRECDFDRMDLDASITNVWDGLEFEPRPDTNLPSIDYEAHPITVRSLLNHLSGIPPSFRNGFSTTAPYWFYRVNWMSGVLADFGQRPVNYFASPNDCGFEIAEELVQETSGDVLSVYMYTNVFLALNMTHSGYDWDDAVLGTNMAVAYDELLEPMPEEFVNAPAAGGAFSSAQDMAAFLKMLLADGQGPYNPIIEPGTARDMMSDQTTGMTLRVGTKYFAPGLGWDTARLPLFEYAGGGCGSCGETATFASYIALATNHGLGVFVAKNSPRSEFSTEAACRLLELAVEEKAALTPPERPDLPQTNFIAVAESNITTLAGTYASATGPFVLGAGTNCLIVGSELFYPRADGWWAATNHLIFMLGFTNVQDSLFAMIRMPVADYVETMLFGMKYTPQAITNAWTNRLNDTWLIQNMPDVEYVRTHRAALAARTSVTNGLILLDVPSVLMGDHNADAYSESRMVLEAYDDELAFVQGVGAGMSATVRAQDENLYAGSYLWLNTKQVPVLTASNPTNYVPCPMVTDWFAFEAEAGVEYFLNLSGGVTGHFMLVNSNGYYQGDGTRGSVLRWTCGASGRYYAGVNFPDDAPTNVTVQFYNYTNTIAQMTAWITNAMAQEGSVGCSIALVDGQDVVWAQGFGYADAEAGLPVTTNSVFHIGSCSKSFTGVAALRYVDEGTLDIDQAVTNYLPGLSWKERYPSSEPITVRHMLSMYSGLPGDMLRNGFTTAPLEPGYALITNQLAQTYPVCPPNYYWNYCNVNFVLLEGLIETLANTGAVTRSFAQIVDDELFTPLGMEATSYIKNKPAISNLLVKPYLLSTNGPVEMPEEYVQLFGTGSMYSRPCDMARFMSVMLRDGDPLLLETTFNEMVTPQGTNAPYASYFSIAPGLGWDFAKYPPLDYAGRLCSKNGGTYAFTANMQLLIDHKLGVAIVVSSQGSSIPDAATVETLRHALMDKEGIPWPTNEITFNVATQAVSQVELDALEGIYVGSSGYDLVEAGEGFITYRMNVPGADNVLSNLTLRTNGWFVAEDHPSTALQFTTNTGEGLMVVRRSVDKGAVMQMPLSVRYEPVAVSEVWSNRVGRKWYVLNESPVDYGPLLGIQPHYELFYSNGVLYSLSGGCVPDRVLAPANDSLAFVVGPNNRGDSCVQVIEPEGDELLLVAGYLFGAAPQDLPVQSNLAGVINRAGEARWYEIAPVDPANPADGITNVEYELTLSGAPTNFLLRLYQPDGATPVFQRQGNGALTIPSGVSPLLLNIQPSVEGAQTGAYELAFSLPLLVRRITLHDGRFGLIWQGPSHVPVDVESSDRLDWPTTFVPVVTNLPAQDLLNTYTNPPSLNPMRFFRLKNSNQ